MAVYLREAARRDLVLHFVYLAENADMLTAERFLQAAEGTFASLADQPFLGAPLSLPSLDGLRKWRVKGFENHLVATDGWALLGMAP